ncbi:MAG: hypothetical protein KDB53_22205 [Planctomycetes bacterium]|nr:hypothetical protein [Planctomycetota bacterium]
MPTLLLLTLLASDPNAASRMERESIADLSTAELAFSDGRTKLSQHRGQPIVYAWFRDAGYSMDAAERAAKLQADYARKGLIVVLLDTESDGSLDQNSKSRAFLLGRFSGYNGASGGLNCSAPVKQTYDAGAGIALIGVDGRLVTRGACREVGGKLTKLIGAELSMAKKGWGDDDLAKKIRALAFGKGAYAAAVALVEANPEPAVQEAIADVENRVAGEFARLDALTAHGRVQAADILIEELAESLKGRDDWIKALAQRQERWLSFRTEALIAFDKHCRRAESALDRGKALSKSQYEALKALKVETLGSERLEAILALSSALGAR